MRGYGYPAGVAGAALGIVAGIAQWAFGNEIPEWTGNKLHPVQLGIITTGLSLIALAAEEVDLFPVNGDLVDDLGPERGVDSVFMTIPFLALDALA